MATFGIHDSNTSLPSPPHSWTAAGHIWKSSTQYSGGDASMRQLYAEGDSEVGESEGKKQFGDGSN